MTGPLESSRCSRCGAARRADAPCPHCLLQLGLSRPEEPGRRARGPRAERAAPAPAELARHFPGLEIEALVGQGGMGVVYRARHRKLERVVALKILAPELSDDPAFAERFLREARALARLDHAHIVAVYDFGETDGLCWLLMEYVDGTTLRQLMARGALTPAQALALVPPLCDALQAAHDLGVVHRDIKPENVLVDRAGQVKIADFGLAKLSGPGGFEPGLTSTAAAVGTPHYMAPEQLQGSPAVDHRADIFSLGVVLYEMLTGELPLGRFELPSRRVEVDVRLDEIVLRALEQEPARRYQRVQEVKTDVQAVRTPAAPAAPDGSPDPAPRPRGWRRLLGRHAWRSGHTQVAWLFAFVALFPLLARGAWKLGVLGLVLLAFLCALWLQLETLRHARRDARLAEELARRPRRARLARGVAFCLAAGAGLALLGGALLTVWELGTDHYVSPTPRVQALAWPSSAERGYELLQRLPASAADPALAPELGTPALDHFRRVQLANPVATAGIALALLVLAGLAHASVRGRTAWRVAWVPPLGAGLLVLVTFALIQVNQAGWPATLDGVGGSARFEGDVEAVRAALVAELGARGHEPVLEAGETLVEKRSRAPRARHEVVAAVPESVFARWELGRGGPRRRAPGVVFDLVGTLDGTVTVLRWDAGMVRRGEPEAERWREQLEEWLGRVRTRVEGG